MSTNEVAETRDIEGAVNRLKGVRVILGRLAISTEQAGDDDEDLMYSLLEDIMRESVDAIEYALDGDESGAATDESIS